MSLLGQRLLMLHDALAGARIAHAFGGAIALAYCTEEPRGTQDLDVNVFLGPDEASKVLAAMPDGVEVGEQDMAAAASEGQVRLWWGGTPIDLFLDVHSFHEEVRERVREVPFMGRRIPVLDCTSLTIFKALFDRTRDWADIEDMIAASSLDISRACGWLLRIEKGDSAAARRLAALGEQPSGG